MPRSFAGKRVLLHFGGVWASAEVWLNGRWVGRHDSGFTSFSYDVTGLVSADADNLLAVRVRQVYPGYVCDTYDDWSLGGIYRDVTLEAMPAKRWIDAVRVVTDFDKDYRDADLKMKVMVIDRHKNTLPGNYRSPGQPYVLRFTLLDAGGDTVQTVERRVAAHTSTGRETAVTMRVAEPRQWNAEHPYLYTLRVELVEPDGVSQASVQRIGFREVTTDGGVLRVNGRPVKLRGVNHHDEHPDVGRATTREHWLRDLRLMKAANINYVRTAHYQHAKGFIELCDSIGMYVGGGRHGRRPGLHGGLDAAHGGDRGARCQQPVGDILVGGQRGCAHQHVSQGGAGGKGSRRHEAHIAAVERRRQPARRD